MTARRAAGVALGLAMLLAGCTAASDADAPTADGTTPTATSASPPTATSSPSASATPTDDGAAGLPDPAGLVGAELRAESSGSSTYLVDGSPLGLTATLASCVGDEAASGDLCSHSLLVAVPPGPDPDEPASASALLLLLRRTGDGADGVPLWEVVDGLMMQTPDGQPAWVASCGAADPGVGYPVPDGASETVPATAAWAVTHDRTALVELDPATATCEVALD